MSQPQDDVVLALLVQKVDTMNSSLKNLTDAVVRLALIEERQAQASLALERAFKAMERIEARYEALNGRVHSLELAEPLQKQTSTWVLSTVWAICGLAVMFIGKRIGWL